VHFDLTGFRLFAAVLEEATLPLAAIYLRLAAHAKGMAAGAWNESPVMSAPADRRLARWFEHGEDSSTSVHQR
jgi:hypothetical protein